MHAPERLATKSNNPSLLVAFLVVVALGVGVFMWVDRSTDPRVVTSPPPATTDANPIPDRPPATGGQAQPQGPTGPINTQSSGGAPAASPQGETPPGMQSAPRGSSQKQ